ncbi:MAG: diacylglycerol kinase family lipid kinase [Vicinamibacterales bacterium]|nr:diacylglycerol kinase family lipid kinase [Vicinamibacterales bacterium]
MSGVAVVINPISGTPRRHDGPAARRALAERVVREAGGTPYVTVTEASGHARALAAEAVARGDALVVAWGGDGTVNEVANALAFTETALGIVAAGSGNGLAFDLGLPRTPEAALRLAIGGATRRIDAGEVDGSPFFNLAGIGLDASIAARFARRGAGRRGLAAYAQITFSEVLRYQPASYQIECDGETLDRRALFIALANSRQYGNGALIAPRARLDDGRFEVVVVEPHSLARMAVRLPSLFRGTLVDSPGLVMRSSTRLRVSAEAPIAFHVDGEPRLGGTTIEVRIHAGALSVRTP